MPSPESLIDATADVLGHWQLEPVVAVNRATSGVMNETYLITTDRRRVVLRRHRRSLRAQVEFEHLVIDHARGKQIPAPAAIPTRAGEVVIDHDGVFYSLFAFARGRQVARGLLTPAHARSMGVMLARLDLALSAFPIAPRPALERSDDLAPVVACVEGLLERIERRGEASEQDRWATDLLRSKAEWLQNATPPIWQQPPIQEFQLVHGDYQESNLFFDDDGSVVDVIDWDKADSGWPAAEIVRTFDLALHLDPVLCAALIHGYRSIRPITLDDLDLAAGNWDYSRVHDHWLFEGIYLRGDDRLRVFLEAGPYVPFISRWEHLRPALIAAW